MKSSSLKMLIYDKVNQQLEKVHLFGNTNIFSWKKASTKLQCLFWQFKYYVNM